MPSYNYVPVFQQLTDDTILLEWDIVVDQGMMDRFEKHVLDCMDQVQVAPYIYPKDNTWIQSRVREVQPPEFCIETLSYNVGTDKTILPLLSHHDEGYVWREYTPIAENDSWCNWSGFGMVYFPLDIVQQYLATEPDHSCDTEWFGWHYECVREKVPVRWDVRPIHLHF